MSVFNIDEYNWGTKMICVGEKKNEGSILITATADDKAGVLLPIFVSNDFVLNHVSKNILNIWNKAGLSHKDTYNMAAKRAIWDIHRHTNYQCSVVLYRDEEAGTTLFFFLPDDQKEYIEFLKEEFVSYIKLMLSATVCNDSGSRNLAGVSIPKGMSDEMAYVLYAAWLSECPNVKLTCNEYCYTGKIILSGDCFLIQHPRYLPVFLNDELKYDKVFMNEICLL